MAILFSTEFGINKSAINRAGLFDAVLDADSHFFINIKRLQATKVPEFADSYEKINAYFHNIGLLLSNAQIGDKLYRTAVMKFDFPEVNGINLGFSKSNRGAGFGRVLRGQIIKDAYEIIQSGTAEPELFHLIGLFEENVGPDRLSDLVARLVYDDIIRYSQRIYNKLGITSAKYRGYQFDGGIPKNPYKNAPILLLPTTILHELPIARDWDDIDRVCRENDAIRAEINALVSAEWSKMASAQKKRYLKEWVFKNPDRLGRVINAYKAKTVGEYNPYSDIDYLISFLVNDLDMPEQSDSSLEASMKILDAYKQWVEYHRGSNVLAEAYTKNAEKTVQRTIHSTALMYCRDKNWHIGPESDGGRGPADFVLSRGNDKTVIEVKLTSNRDCVHGLEVQIEEYAKAEQTDNKIFVVVDNGKNSGRVSSVLEKRDELAAQNKNPATVLVIDAKPKRPASVYTQSQ